MPADTATTQSGTQPNKTDPCVVVIFGASGDLTSRKLIPALFEMHLAGRLNPLTRVLGVARSEFSDEQFRAHLEPGAREAQKERFERRAWDEFARRVHYHAANAGEPAAYPALMRRVGEVGVEFSRAGGSGGGGDSTPNTLFYLAVAPTLYTPIIEAIGSAGVVHEGRRWCVINPALVPWQRIIVEKPFGSDLRTAVELNKALGRVFEEDAIFRIDHYLGKELVQNIFAMRFANSIFEPLWNSQLVDHVQVTAAETIGVGARAANYYDTSGALRDMVQSHLLQVLALVAMEPPSSYSATAVSRERIKLLDSARLIRAEDATLHASLGRYGSDETESAYESTRGVDTSRRTETYAALRVEFETWRWSGVPFYLRSGKKMARKVTEVVVQFKDPPTNLFRGLKTGVESAAANRLVIAIAPREGLRLSLKGKVPGAAMRLDATELALDYQECFGGEPVEAYGPLLVDAMRGDRTLYKHRDEVEGAWRICQPVLDSQELREAIENYSPGSWGPIGADALLARDGRAWHNPG